MKIKSIEYVGSFVDAESFPEVGAEFVFIGRSNVGKSSLINKLVNRKNVARTSNTPGKTRAANFYKVNDEFGFIDMPGYGFAQVSKTERGKWERLINGYLKNRVPLRGILLLLDIRHNPMKNDVEMVHRLAESERPLCLVFSKTDKVKERDINPRIGKFLAAVEVAPTTAVIPFSAESGRGRREVLAWIEDHRVG